MTECKASTFMQNPAATTRDVYYEGAKHKDTKMTDDKPHIRDTIIIFAEAMDRKLRRDDDKKCAWETDSMFALVDQLLDEINEFQDAFIIYQTTAHDPDGKNLMWECCDVANQIMMIFSQINPLTQHNRRGVAQHRLPRP